MTPMVDIAFLLLIFYMVTTQFKPPEKRQVTLPSSNSQIKLPDRNVFLITVPTEDSVFIDFVTKRRVTLEDGSVVENTFRNVVSIPFGLVDETGKAVQRMRGEELSNVDVLYPGEAQDDIRRKAKEDLLASFVVVKADKDVEYGVVEKLFNSLRAENLTSFQIITELEKE